jgi:glutathione S-transferase
MKPLVLADRGCPFAHRVLALLDHLGVACSLVEAPPGERPAALAEWSPSGRLPFLVDGDLAIGESRVMLEHLAEVHSFAAAYPSKLTERTLHREAMALVDAYWVPALFAAPPLAAARLTECLDRLEALASVTPLDPSLLVFHVAPIWLRLQWWKPNGAVTSAIRQRAKLVAWLDAAAATPAIVRTSPLRADNVRDYEIVCALSSP